MTDLLATLRAARDSDGLPLPHHVVAAVQSLVVAANIFVHTGPTHSRSQLLLREALAPFPLPEDTPVPWDHTTNCDA